ncbi:hypothetical protein ACUZXU_09340 [Staphylococcus epidermidis]|uniref:hypothetical protein n=2 Tax=Staphylococcus epidermidis TaxID=1282 RepID=UPI000207CE4A|nr:hypothetical protein [Staphylococcus epidermidis]MBA9873853.1 hypothetical protein [Ralstonia insidiosa]MDU6126198.1 hypothetical protein [Veillonella sp.]EGG63228.1 conserved domain protein [Staphylococcus epidermidis VCU144]MBC8789271.1 hypothetical protein [Staphylococcus epidermidis]MBM0797620.1 hypothetical protein [Staphylococcus epidermidis]
MFEIEHMNEVFDYSLIDGETAEFLKEREYTINGIAEDARIKIGKELKKAKNKLANHHGGVFQKWVQSGGMSIDDAYYYINLNELSRNLDDIKKDNFLNAPKSLQKEVMKKNTPDDLKQKVLDGDITTHKEYKQLQKDKEELKQQNAQLQSQVKQAKRSESIARKKLEDEQNREPEVIEREVIKEVVPDEIQQQLEQFKQKFERESDNANELRNELQRYRNSFGDPNQAYEEKELTRLERESSINAHKISISIQNFIKENSVETYRLDTVIKANTKSKERLQENVALLKEFTTNLEAMLNGRIVVN